MKYCDTCHAPLVREPGESTANHRKRVTCRTSACRKPYKLKKVHECQDRKKQRMQGQPKEKRRRFVGKVTAAMDSFLRGGR